MRKAVYIGAGTDLKPVIALRNITLFYYIDCRPYYEFGINKRTLCPPNCIGMSMPPFITNIYKEMEQYGFTKIQDRKNKLLFQNEIGQTIVYFINTSIPHHIHTIIPDINDFTDFIVIGHDPDSTILQYTKHKVHFWGNSQTWYKKLNHEDYEYEVYNNTLFRLHRESQIRNKFKNFNMIMDDQKVKTTHSWNAFLNI